MKKPLLYVCFLVMSLCLAGCAANNATVSMHGEMATPYHITKDAQVDVSPIRVYVQPNISPKDTLRGLFVPLRVTQDIAGPKNISHNVSRQIWQVWLAQRSFEALEYNDSAVPFQVSDALALAKRRGANVLVGGYITHFMDGGGVGTSAISMQIEMYEVETGAMLWSMAQAGSIDKDQAADLFLVGIQERMPADPMGLTARSVGYDLGMKIKEWVHPHADGSGMGHVF